MEQEGSISEGGGNEQSSGAGAPGTVRGAVPEGMASSQRLGTQEHWDAIISERTANSPRIWRYRINLIWRKGYGSTKVDAKTQDSTGCFST